MHDTFYLQTKVGMTGHENIDGARSPSSFEKDVHN